MRLRVLIIGAGKMGQAHAAAFASLPEAEIVGVVSRGGATAAALAAQYGVPFHGTDWRTVLAQSGAVACVVAVAHELTGEVTRAVIEAGLPVLAEKPVALTSAAIHDLAALAAKRGVVAMAAVNRRFYPGIVTALDVARLIGPVYHLGVIAPDSAEPRRVKGTQSAFVCDHWLQMNTIHAIDLLRMVGGDVVSVCGFRRQQARADHVTLAAALQFKGGVLGTFSMPGGLNTEWELRFGGADYEVVARPFERVLLRVGSNPPRPIPAQPPRSPHKPGLREQACAFVDAVMSGASPAWPASDLSDHAQSMALVERLEALPALDAPDPSGTGALVAVQ